MSGYLRYRRRTLQTPVHHFRCAHLPCLEAGITRRGFVRDGATQWHTAAVLPTVRSILSLLRALPRTAGPADPAGPDTAASSTTPRR